MFKTFFKKVFNPKNIAVFFVYVVTAIILVASIKGTSGNPMPRDIGNLDDRSQPFELSNERGRFALAQSVVENKSLTFSTEIARYVTPDLGFINGEYVSLLAPGVSFIVIPFYFVGKTLNHSQLISFSASTLFAFLNFVLIVKIVEKLTKSKFAGLISALVFIFGTSAFSYSTTLYQHHFTTFFVLVSLYLCLWGVTFFSSFLFGSILAISFLVEYIGPLFLLPSFLLFVSKAIVFKKQNSVTVQINKSIFAGIVGFALFILPTLFYNSKIYSSPFKLAGTVHRVEYISFDQDGEPIKPNLDEVEYDKTISGFFDPIKIPFSWNILFASSERGMLFYAPLMIFSIFVFFFISQLKTNSKNYVYTTFSIFLIVILLFGMWDDVWGGWAFGSRYSIPGFAALSLLLGLTLYHWRRKFIYFLCISIVFFYSISVNIAGALTTNAIPPTRESLSQTLTPVKYLYNFDLLGKGVSSSYLYNTYLWKFLSAAHFGTILGMLILSMFFISYYFMSKDEKI